MKQKNNMLEKVLKKSRIKRYTQFLIGVFLLAANFNILLLPNNFVCGGFTGISLVLKHFLGIEPSDFIMISAVFLILISFPTLGKKKTMHSIFGALLFPVAVKLTKNIGLYLDMNTSNLLLSAIFASVINGVASGLIYKAGFTTGGTDIINQIVSKYLKISMGKSKLYIDGMVVLSGAFVFGIEKLMYALIILYVASTLVDRVLFGTSKSKAFYIVTSKQEEARKFILNYLGHGVTIFEATGGYKKENQNVLFCVVPTKEYFKLKEGISEIDKDSFFVVTDAYEVYGGE